MEQRLAIVDRFLRLLLFPLLLPEGVATCDGTNDLLVKLSPISEGGAVEDCGWDRPSREVAETREMGGGVRGQITASPDASIIRRPPDRGSSLQRLSKTTLISRVDPMGLIVLGVVIVVCGSKQKYYYHYQQTTILLSVWSNA